MDLLYKKNNNNQVLYWGVYEDINSGNKQPTISVTYGILGGTPRKEMYPLTMKGKTISEIIDKEITSRINEKRKQGYISLSEFADMREHPAEDLNSQDFINFCKTYLKTNLTNNNSGALLPMLAKTYNGNCWNKISTMYGQWKINGLRCFISAYQTNDMFRPIRLKFQSREGIYWSSLEDLEEKLLILLPPPLIKKMLDENYILDGELYLPGYSVNEINHFVKDPKSAGNKKLQYWCYDLAIENVSQHYRDLIRESSDMLGRYIHEFVHPEQHLNCTSTIVTLPSIEIVNNEQAIEYRNKFIDLGFEGLILRNPDVEYQFGRRRANYMEKFKATNEGDFEIIDIIKEDKRDLPIIVCRNDINDNVFETRLSVSHEAQQEVLYNKEKYIGKFVHLNYGERAGVQKVPFHVKDCIIK